MVRDKERKNGKVGRRKPILDKIVKNKIGKNVYD